MHCYGTLDHANWYQIVLCGNLDCQYFRSTLGLVYGLVSPAPWRNFCCCQERYGDLRTIYHYIGDAGAPPNSLTCASFTRQQRRLGACVVVILWMVRTESQPEQPFFHRLSDILRQTKPSFVLDYAKK